MTLHPQPLNMTRMPSRTARSLSMQSTFRPAIRPAETGVDVGSATPGAARGNLTEKIEPLPGTERRSTW